MTEGLQGDVGQFGATNFVRLALEPHNQSTVVLSYTEGDLSYKVVLTSTDFVALREHRAGYLAVTFLEWQ